VGRLALLQRLASLLPNMLLPQQDLLSLVLCFQ
jgi:hypothetical protein